jgi:hypothetical protein
MRRIPLLCNGSSRIGLIDFGREDLAPTFARSTRRAIRLLRFCPAFRNSARLSENRFEAYSSSSAFYVWYWAVFYDGGRDVSRGDSILEKQARHPDMPACINFPSFITQRQPVLSQASSPPDLHPRTHTMLHTLAACLGWRHDIHPGSCA